MRQSRILAVEHVEIEGMENQLEVLRWFYGELANLQELVELPSEDSNSQDSNSKNPSPEDSSSWVLRFRSERIMLRIRLKEQPAIEPIAARVKLLVENLEETSLILEEQGYPCCRISGIVWSDQRIGTWDPAGNRIEIKQSWPETTL